MRKQITLAKGFTTQPVKLEDVEELNALLNLVAREMMGVDDFEQDELEADLQTPGLNLETDTLLVRNPEGKIIGYQDVFATDPVPVRPDIFGRVHPDYMNMGISSYLLQWAIERAKHVYDKVPEDARIFVRGWTPAGWQPSIQLLEDHGFNLQRHYFDMRIDMDAPPPKPEWPDGIEVRKISIPEELALWFRTFDEAFQDHFGYIKDKPFEQAFEQFKHYNLNDPAYDPDLWYIAMDGDQPAGILQGRKHSAENPDFGQIHLLGVRRPWRKRGLGLALLHEGFNLFWERRKKTVVLGVDADNLTGALDLYLKAGMHSYRKISTYELELRPGKDLTNAG